MSVEGNLRLLNFSFTLICGWLTKLATLSQPVSKKLKHIVVAHVLYAGHRYLI